MLPQPSGFINIYASKYAEIKNKGSNTVSNIFLDIKELDSQFKNKPCRMETTENSLFLLIPRHNAFIDLLFLSSDTCALQSDLAELFGVLSRDRPIRASIVGREPEAENLADIFAKQNFHLGKKLLRTRLSQPSDSILQAMEIFVEEQRPYLGFAKLGDEEEILEILKESFDIASDNLPEPDEITKRIQKREIAVIRKNRRILALTYFAFSHGIMNCYYDVTRPGYRGSNGFFMALSHFVRTELQKNNINPKRILGWREEAKKKLVRHAKKSNELPDGIVIYNMLLDPSPKADA